MTTIDTPDFGTWRAVACPGGGRVDVPRGTWALADSAAAAVNTPSEIYTWVPGSNILYPYFREELEMNDFDFALIVAETMMDNGADMFDAVETVENRYDLDGLQVEKIFKILEKKA